MPSLTSLAATHGAILLIDSASACVQVGLWQTETEASWRQSEREAGIAVFECVDAVLAGAGLGVRDLGACAFCEGPGSILGIRTAAMALRTWQAVGERARPAFAYRSLELVAHDLAGAGTRPPFAVIADARRDAWHWVEVTTSQAVRPLQRVASSVLADFAGDLFTPAGFRVWTPPPRAVGEVPYPLAALWRRQRAADLLQPAPQPDAFLHEDSVYVTWTPQIHRAGVSPSRTRADS
jgi:tRNA threonylcarbamoyladenosine biosynthesis protein TsaB